MEANDNHIFWTRERIIADAREWITEGTAHYDGEEGRTGWANTIERLIGLIEQPPRKDDRRE